MDIFSDEIENDSATASALFATQQADDLNNAQESQASADDLSDTQPQFRPTGIKYFDEKIATNTTTPYDAYLARKFLNIDITMNANVNLKAEHKTENIGKLKDEIRETIAGLRLADEAIMQADEEAGGLIFKHKNTGVWGGLNRWANKISGGGWGLSNPAAQFATRQEALTKAIARAETRGKTTNMALQDAKDNYSAGFRSEPEYRSRIFEGGIKQQTLYLKEQLRDMARRGIEIPEYLTNTLKEYEEKLALHESGQYSKEKFKSISDTAKAWREQNAMEF